VKIRWILSRPWLLALALTALGGRRRRGAIRFEEIAEKAGAQRPCTTPGSFQGLTADVLGMFTSGGAAVAVGDYNNDGDDDLFVTNSDEGSRTPSSGTTATATLHRCDRRGRRGRRQRSGSPSSPTRSGSTTTTTAGQDLLLARFGTPVLFRNLGGGKFEDVSEGPASERSATPSPRSPSITTTTAGSTSCSGNYFRR
jgi:hypothetical protein